MFFFQLSSSTLTVFKDLFYELQFVTICYNRKKAVSFILWRKSYGAERQLSYIFMRKTFKIIFTSFYMVLKCLNISYRSTLFSKKTHFWEVLQIYHH